MNLHSEIRNLLNLPDDGLDAYLRTHQRLFAAVLDAIGTPEALRTLEVLAAHGRAFKWLEEAMNHVGGIPALKNWAMAALQCDFVPYRFEKGDLVPPYDHGVVYKVTDPIFTFPAYVQLTQIEGEDLRTSWYLSVRWRLQGSVDATLTDVDDSNGKTTSALIHRVGAQISKAVFGESVEGRIFLEAPRAVVGGEAPNYGTDTPMHVETPINWWCAKPVNR